MNDETLHAMAEARSVCERRVLEAHDKHMALVNRSLLVYTAEVELAYRQRDLAIETAKLRSDPR